MKIAKPILVSLIFAILLIASAYFLKGNPVKDWVHAVLYIVWICFFFRFITSPKKCSAEVLQK